jgi:hypothetical protein
MLIPEPVTLLILATLGAGYAYEGYKWEHPKDPEPPVYYVYDPAYFQLGDEKACGDATNGPCKGGVKPIAIAEKDKSCSKCKN